MQTLLLVLKKHNLVDAFSQIVLVEATEDILWVTLVEDFDEFVELKLLQDD